MLGFTIRKAAVLVAILAATFATAAVASGVAMAGVNGLPGNPGTVSCSYGPQVNVHMARMHGINTTNLLDYQTPYWSATLYEWVKDAWGNGAYQTQSTPLYHASWISEFDDVLQWLLPNNSAVGLYADFFSFPLVGTRYIYVKYTYWWNDYRTGKQWSDSTMVGPIQC